MAKLAAEVLARAAGSVRSSYAWGRIRRSGVRLKHQGERNARLFRPRLLVALALLTAVVLIWLWRKSRRDTSSELAANDVEQRLYAPLGSGTASRYGIGNKGTLLDRAARAGLPVPRGIILFDAAWRQAQRENLILVQAETVAIPDPLRLLDALNLPPFSRPLAVRSAFSAEDRQTESLAGFFSSKLFVNPHNDRDLAAALAEVWASALKQPDTFRRDVLIMEMVEAEQAGVAFTEREFEDDLVNFTSGTADKLVSGAVEGQSTLAPKLHRWEGYLDFRFPIVGFGRGDNGPNPKSYSQNTRMDWLVRLQHLLRDIRREFGPADWDVEWADDGRHCWLVQLRPITRPTRRNEAFTGANLKEILPDLPSRYTTTLIASCADGLFAFYRRFDRRLPKQRSISEVFYGRPFFNISLLTEMMRAWGLPTRLVTGNIGGETDREFGLNPVRFFSNTFILFKLGWAQLRAVSSAQRTINAILARTRPLKPAIIEQRSCSEALYVQEVLGSDHRAGKLDTVDKVESKVRPKPLQRIEPHKAGVDRFYPTFTACVELHRWLFTTLVTEMFSLTAAMSGPLLLLRRFGVLAEHNARQRTIATEMYTDLEPLRFMVAHSPEIRAVLERGEVPGDPHFRRIWQAYLDKHGHRGIYESDIARPRLHEAPQAILVSLAHPTSPRRPPPPPTLLGRLTLPLWWQASRTMRAREELRYHAIIGFDRLRQTMLILADRAVSSGVLPHRDALWMLEIEEIYRLDQGWQPEVDFFARRRREIEQLAAFDLPDLFYRFDDLEQYNVNKRSARSTGAQRLQGLGLTTGQVTGKAWVLSEPRTDLPTGFTAGETILVARSIDAGWIPTFSRVAGAVIEIGGDLSHGSIILREIGLPAITNVRGATRHIKNGDKLVLQADSGIVALE